MINKKQIKPLHPRNFHIQKYDFEALIKTMPELEPYVSVNKYDTLSIDFSNAQAVLTLNKALLSHFYDIKNWKIPENYLCPPIPGRADYIHYLADLLAYTNNAVVPKGNKITGLDVGIGANCIYPIIGNKVYGWNFVGSDIDQTALDAVQNIINDNVAIVEHVSCRLQNNSSNILTGIIEENDKFDFVVCNPPFHKSKEDAKVGQLRKVSNLTKEKVTKATQNFGGQANELWCKGGEVAFIKQMVKESTLYKNNCFWYTSLVSKKENLREIHKAIKQTKPVMLKTIEMKQGQKISRFVAWTYLSQKEQKQWKQNNWSKESK